MSKLSYTKIMDEVSGYAKANKVSYSKACVALGLRPYAYSNAKSYLKGKRKAQRLEARKNNIQRQSIMLDNKTPIVEAKVESQKIAMIYGSAVEIANVLKLIK
jgi:hypothetical protein